jgi:ParB-like chromosome segregation protein Spo0J
MTEPYVTEVRLIELDKLRQHEEVDPAHLKELKEQIRSDKILKFAIVVDKNTNVILDGEHRFNSLKELGCRRIPVVYVDYNSPDIQVQSWRNNLHLTKKDIIEAGLSEKKLPPKTSKHMIKIGDCLLHISAIQKRTDVPLEVLNDIELVDIKKVKPTMCTELREVLPLYAKFLDTGIVDDPIIIDEKTSVILDGHEVFQALDCSQLEKCRP